VYSRTAAFAAYDRAFGLGSYRAVAGAAAVAAGVRTDAERP
jgi:hypothetical protein